MKVIREDVAASGKTRQLFAIGTDEIRHLIGLLEKCQQYTPKTEETYTAMQRNRNLLTTFAKALKEEIRLWGHRDFHP